MVVLFPTNVSLQHLSFIIYELRKESVEMLLRQVIYTHIVSKLGETFSIFLQTMSLESNLWNLRNLISSLYFKHHLITLAHHPIDC